MLISLLLSVFVVMGGLIAMTNWVSQTARTSVANNLEAALNSAHNNFSFFIDNQIDNVERWASDPELIAYTRALLNVGNSPEALVSHPAQEAVRYLMLPYLNRYADRGYFIIGPDNISLASSRDINTGTVNLLANHPEFLQEVRKGNSLLSPLIKSDVALEDINGVVRDDVITGFVVSPMYDTRGQILALLALRLDVEKVFNVALDQERVGTSGEIYALNDQGVMLSRSRFEEDLVERGLLQPYQKSSLNLSIRNPLSNVLTVMAQDIADRKTGGQLEPYLDYRAISVVGQWLWDERLSIGLAIEMDYAEAFRQYENIRHILLIGAIVLLLIITVLFYVWRAKNEDRQAFIQQIESSERKIRTILETTNEGFWLIDVHARTLDVNPAMCRILGLARDNVVGRPIFEFVDDQNLDVFKMQLKNRERGDHNVYEIELLKSDGPSTPCIFNATPIYDESGVRIGSFSLVNDISSLKENERSLEKAVETANQANQAKSNFLSSMSHELRTPLNAILGFAQLLEMRLSDEKDLRFTKQIITGGEHLLGLINQILDLARIEQGRLNLSLESIYVEDLIRDCMTIVSPLSDAKNITLSKPNLDNSYVIQADYLRMKQCLLNLLSNAIKYNVENGKVSLEVVNVDETYLRISVSDTGRGIEPDKIARVFKPFDRLDMDKYEIEGTGIGLTLCKKLIEDMSGEIGFESKVDVGSTFWLDIPKDLPQVALATYEKNLASGLLKNDSRSEQFRLLYVEDYVDNVALLEMITDEIPALQMMSAATAEAGLELVEAYQFDIIILDVNLPGMSGIEAVKKMRALKNARDIPIVALSGNAEQTTIEAGLRAGFDQYLLKPVKVGEIYRTLATLMDQKLEMNPALTQLEKEVS